MAGRRPPPPPKHISGCTGVWCSKEGFLIELGRSLCSCNLSRLLFGQPIRIKYSNADWLRQPTFGGETGDLHQTICSRADLARIDCSASGRKVKHKQPNEWIGCFAKQPNAIYLPHSYSQSLTVWDRLSEQSAYPRFQRTSLPPFFARHCPARPYRPPWKVPWNLIRRWLWSFAGLG
jgi:hypothetical protein